MAIRYNQYKTDGTAVGTIITWPGNTIPDGYLVCDGTTYTITGVSNTQYRFIASIISGQYDASDTYPPGDTTGTGTFTLPNMNVDDVVVQRNNETLGSRAGSTSAAFGSTKLNADQWPSHRHSLPRQNYFLTNDVNAVSQGNHYGASSTSPRCPNGAVCMSYPVIIFGRRGIQWTTSPCPNPRLWGRVPCGRPGGTAYGPQDAASGAGMGPRTTFAYGMGNAGANSASVSSHSHSTNPVQASMRMQFLIKAF